MVLRHISRLRPLYEPDTGGGTGGGNPNPNPANPGGTQADDRPNIQGLLQKHQGDAMQVITTLLTENYALRDARRAWNDERQQLAGRIPGEGAVVLSSDQAQAWQAYGQLGTVEQIREQLQAAGTAPADLAKLQRDVLLRDVAAAADYDLDVLRTVGGDVQYVVKDETKNGKAVKVAYVVAKDGDKDVETPIADYASTHWAKFLSSLQVTPQRPAIGTPQVRAGQGQQQGQGQQATEKRRPLARF